MEAFSNLTAHLKKASSAISALIQIGEALKTEGFEKIGKMLRARYYVQPQTGLQVPEYQYMLEGHSTLSIPC